MSRRINHPHWHIYAAAAMRGLIENNPSFHIEVLTKRAAEVADAMIVESEKEPPNEIQRDDN
mgnify:CR=1 FL=1